MLLSIKCQIKDLVGGLEKFAVMILFQSNNSKLSGCQHLCVLGLVIGRGLLEEEWKETDSFGKNRVGPYLRLLLNFDSVS